MPVENALAAILRKRPVTWETILTLRENHQIGNLDIAALVLRHGWHWRKHKPYRITLPDGRPDAARRPD
ncbi:hypothetical protein ABZ801_27020 [Actinomadura sp. NPDC047616]|uniref:hypothetical protein n=1 Tax=Actinomadura sp. NPDC047616 TaxID=3155914 RepID=UPI0033EFAF70